MKDNSSRGWKTTVYSDEALNFAMFVGCVYGLISKDTYSGLAPLWPPQTLNIDNKNSKSDLAKQWNIWWLQLIEKRAKNVVSENLDPRSELFYPPEFNPMINSGLRKYCVKAWPLFEEWWRMGAGGSISMMFWESQVFKCAYVSEFIKLHNMDVRPFNLYIDLVYTGISERIEVGDNYVLMPLDIRLFRDEKWWMEKLSKLNT